MNCTLRAILKSGRTWRQYGEIPKVEWSEDLKPKKVVHQFDANTSAQIIRGAPQPYRLMCLIATCGLRIGESTPLNIADLDFGRKLINITAARLFQQAGNSTQK